MSDLEERAYQQATAVLGVQRSALKRYGEIVSAQGRAATANDIDQVAELAENVDLLIAEMAAAGRSVEPLQRRLRAGTFAGPRTDALRQLMTSVADLAEITQSSVRGLVRELAVRRNDVGRQLAALDAAAVAGSRYAAAAPPAPFVFDRLG